MRSRAWESLLKLGVTYSLVMILASLALGVTYREVSKAYLSSLPLDKSLLASYYLSLMHGHALVAGALLVTTLLVITYLLMKSGVLSEGDLMGLRKAMVVLVIGSLAAVVLLTYKGLVVATNYVGLGSLGMANEALFDGDSVVREGIYGVSHLLLGIGVTWYVIKLMKASLRLGKS